MKKLCIIPARGGSKRIPRKNIKDFNGAPIITYPLSVALAPGLFDEVCVSTDDEEIRALAGSYAGVSTHLRSPLTSHDHSPIVDVVKEVLASYRAVGKEFDYCCCVFATSVLLDQDMLEESLRLMVEHQCDSVFPVVEYPHPVQRRLKNSAGLISFAQPEFRLTRTQDLEPYYYDAGLFYWFSTATFLEKGDILTDRTRFFPVSSSRIQDIDTPEDWALAEFKYQFFKSGPSDR
jgi:N-acylneuraminate cytidylyltransferase